MGATMLRWIALAAIPLLLLMILVLRTSCEAADTAAEPSATMEVDRPLPPDLQRRLDETGWARRVGDRLGLWVSVERQTLVGLQHGKVVFVYPCSTAKRGTGSAENSYQTPLGWHEVRERFGDGLPEGAVFNERRQTGKVWSPRQRTTQDLILTRILWLTGLEPGLNAGKGIDSHDRFIYIHGTPEEEKLGTPASMGCIRLSNRAVIDVFDRSPSGTPVLITSW